MNTLHFDNYEDFAYAVAEKYWRIKEKDDLDSISIIGKYIDIKEIMAILIAIGYGISFIDKFADSEWNNYEDEFILSLNDDEIWCEPAKRKNGYLRPESNVVYLLDNCNSKIIPLIESDEIYEVEIGYNDCDGDCENCKDAIYKVNGKEVSEDEYYDILAKYEELDDLIDKYNERIELLESLYRLFGV